MARVELTDVRGTLSASLAGVQTDTAQGAVGAGLATVGDALGRLSEQSGDAFYKIGRQFVQRRNEREYTQEQIRYWEIESDLLNGEGGALTLPAQDAIGSTERTVSRLQEYVTKRATELSANPVVRDEFLQFSAKQLANARNVVAANEATRSEELRISSAHAARSAQLRNVVTLQPSRFLPHVAPDGTTTYADPELIAEIESKTEMINRGWSDEQVSEETRAIIADQAAQSVFYLLDQGPQNVAAARDIANAYEGEWDATMRAAVNRRLETEVTYDMMDPIVASAAAGIMDSGRTITAKALSEQSVGAFVAQYRSLYGEAPPDAAVQEIKRRAVTQVQLIDDDMKTRNDAVRGGDLVEFIKTVNSGDRAAIESHRKRLLMSAHGENDLAFARTVLSLGADSGGDGSKAGKAHPTHSTPEGIRAVIDGLAGKSQYELLQLVSKLSASDFNKHVGPLLGMGGQLPSNDEIGLALDRARNAYEGKGPYQKTAAADKDGTYLTKFTQLSNIASKFFEEQKRLPTTDELNGLALDTFRSLDDSGLDYGGAGGTISEFLLNPEPLDVAQTKDRALLTLLADTTRFSPRIRNLVSQQLRVSTTDITPELLAKHPRLVAEMLELALVLDAPVFRAEGGASVGFRSDLKNALGGE